MALNSIDGLELMIFPIFFAGVDQNPTSGDDGSFEFAGTVSLTDDPFLVPEPPTLLLYGIGLLGLGAFAGRRHRFAA